MIKRVFEQFAEALKQNKISCDAMVLDETYKKVCAEHNEWGNRAKDAVNNYKRAQKKAK